MNYSPNCNQNNNSYPPIINIVGPEGPQGPQGEIGPQGPQGAQGRPGVSETRNFASLAVYNIAVSVSSFPNYDPITYNEIDSNGSNIIPNLNGTITLKANHTYFISFTLQKNYEASNGAGMYIRVLINNIDPIPLRSNDLSNAWGRKSGPLTHTWIYRATLDTDIEYQVSRYLQESQTYRAAYFSVYQLD